MEAALTIRSPAGTAGILGCGVAPAVPGGASGWPWPLHPGACAAGL